jgi:uncharacterized membrane protein (UPF0182 family)
MPELRLVVLAIQERVGYGKSFEDAMTHLFGEAGKTPPQPTAAPPKDKVDETAPKPAAQPPSGENVQQLITKAVQEFEDYQRLTSQGKLAEAGQKLEQHKRTLEELKRMIGKQ